jgi:hypothetical protein
MYLCRSRSFDLGFLLSSHFLSQVWVHVLFQRKYSVPYWFYVKCFDWCLRRSEKYSCGGANNIYPLQNSILRPTTFCPSPRKTRYDCTFFSKKSTVSHIDSTLQNALIGAYNARKNTPAVARTIFTLCRTRSIDLGFFLSSHFVFQSSQNEVWVHVLF